ncbi:MAG: bifunctional oligoribonuclease/PAP phosphatase NrnA [Pirellulaceae bacterium]
MPGLRTARRSKSDLLLEVLDDYQRCLIVMHDNPDPDAVATGWAVHTLIVEKLGKPVRLVGGGGIVRAENRHMVELLQPPIELLDEIRPEAGTAAVLVDCGLGTTNHVLTRAAIHPVAVIDHHMNGTRGHRLPFRDIREKAAASASIAASYLREQRIEPGPKLASALLYAIRTETCGNETYHSRLDRSIIVWLTSRAEPSLLAEIENAPLSREYYGDLVLAMQSTFLYGDVAFCLLPRASGAEIVGEVADMLIRCQGVRRVLCGAVVGDAVLLSLRTSKDGEHATRLLQKTLDGLGGGGGHSHRAGGKIPVAGSRGGKVGDDLENVLRTRWLSACGIERQRGTRLVAKREIVENL